MFLCCVLWIFFSDQVSSRGHQSRRAGSAARSAAATATPSVPVEQVIQQTEAVRKHFIFPMHLTATLYFDRFEQGSTYATNFSVAFSSSTYHDYALACRYLLSPTSAVSADHISGCFSDLVFSHRNMMMLFIQEMTYSAIFVAAKNIPSEQVHSHAGILLATTYALPAIQKYAAVASVPSGSATESAPPDRMMCLFGKFSLKITYFMLSREDWHVVLLVDLDVSSTYFLDIMNIFEVTAKVNRRPFTVTQLGQSVYRYDPETGLPITNRTLLNEEAITCDGIFVWGSEKQLLKSLKYVKRSSESKLPVVIFVNEFDPHQNATPSFNALYTNKKRLNKLTNRISWTGSLSWPTFTAVQTRRNVFGHVQQEFELSMIRNSTQADTWFGVMRPTPEKRPSSGNDVVFTFDSLSGNLAASGDHQERYRRRTCHRGQYPHLIIVSYTNEIFFQNALGLQQAIQSLHVADVIATGDATLDRIYALLGTQFVSECRVIQIVIGPHEPNWLMETYIVYDAEQVWSVFMDIPAYISLLNEAAAVMVMSTRHARKYERIQGFNVSNVYAIPFYTSLPAPASTVPLDNPCNETLRYIDPRIIETLSDVGDPLVATFTGLPTEVGATEKVNVSGISMQAVSVAPMDGQYKTAVNETVDILFFGSCSDHRREFLSMLDSMHDVYAARGRRKPLRTNLKCISDWKQALIGHRRDIVVRDAKVVVNIHVFPQSSLEVHRLNYLLAWGKCVVSERSLHDPELDDDYSEGVLFGDDFEHIADRVFDLLTNETQRLLCEQGARRVYDRTMSDTLNLGLAFKNILPFV
jgi:hypothetical protein